MKCWFIDVSRATSHDSVTNSLHGIVGIFKFLIGQTSEVFFRLLRTRSESTRFLPITHPGSRVCKLVAHSPVWISLHRAMYELSILNRVCFVKPNSHVTYSVIQFACRKNPRNACWLFMSYIRVCIVKCHLLARESVMFRE